MAFMSGKEKSVEIQPEKIMSLHWDFARASLLRTALELDIFTHLHEGQNTVEKINRILGGGLRSTRILLDALVGIGLLGKTRGNYKLSPESKTFLVKGELNYLGHFLLGDRQMDKYWEYLPNCLRKGKPISEMLDPELRNEFFKHLVKTLFPVSFASGVILGKKLGVGKSLKKLKILDLGCGAAPWSLAFALADSNSNVVAVDFPEILEIAQAHAKRFHVTSQFEFRAGDFHQVEWERQSYDIIFLGHICHGEGEMGTRKLIKRAFEALKPGGRLLIAEYVANDLRTGPEIPLMFGLVMLLFTEHGDIFSVKELKRWLNLAGFKKVSAQAVQFPVTVVVGVK